LIIDNGELIMDKKKRILKFLKDLVEDKRYIRNQIKSGKSIDNRKLKICRIAKVKL
jgi:hypothetical protein